MPKAYISTLDCAKVIEDGDIEIRYFGQFNTEIHHHEKTQLISPEMSAVYLYSEKGSFCIPARHYAYVDAHVKHKLISRSPNLKLKTIFLDLNKEKYPTAHWGNIAIFSPSNLLDNLLAFGVQHWSDKELKEVGLASLKKMLAHILISPLKLHAQPPKSESLLKVVEYITQSISEQITVASLSQHVNIPERTLSRQFKKETDITIFQFIKLSRMQLALELLEDQSLHISEIVYKIGYDSIPTFSNLFKELIGISPQRYRQGLL
ncbi:helix-turn-helix domain-containing protein [Sphingobacterium faecium]